MVTTADGARAESARAAGTSAAAQLRAMADRLEDMVQAAAKTADVSPAQVRVLVQDMATAIEEMRVAEEELAFQTDQLAASNLAVDAERERYGQLFEFAPDAYLETDGFGKIVEANGTAEQMLGVRGRFLAGKLLQAFISADDVRAVRGVIERLRRESGPVTLEVEVRPRDLPPVPVELRVASHLDPTVAEGGALRMRWLLRDISERLKLDRELRQLHADVELLATLAEVNRLVAGTGNPVDRLLQGLVELAGKACGGAGAAVTLVDNRGRVAARAVSGDAARELCELQLAEGGPALSVLVDKEPRWDAAADLAAWPALAEAMAHHGVEWIASRPIIPVDGGDVGVISIFGRGGAADVERSMQLLAEHAAGVIANGLLYRSATELAHQLGNALESRGVIEQAKGVLMAWQGCTPDAAFDILRRVSQRENRKLRVIAEEIVDKAIRAAGRR